MATPRTKRPPASTAPNPARTQLQVQSQRLGESLLKEASLDPDPNGGPRQDEVLFAITGERGTGKTTLLRHLHATSRDHGGLTWMPIIRPDSSMASQSLLITVIGSIVSLAGSLAAKDDANSELPVLAERTLRAALFARKSSLSELFDNSGSLGQFTADAASILRRGSDLESELQVLVSHILRATGSKGLVVPIDDLDLIPAELGRVLADARLLGAQRGILPLACLSRTDLRAKLRAEVIASFPGMGGQELERLVDQQVMKTLRPDRIFQPLQLPRQDRLHFSPVGATESLGDCLGSVFAILDKSSESSLSLWFTEQIKAWRSKRPADLRWLPSTYRALEHLHFEAAALRDALAKPLWTSEVGARVAALLDGLSREHSSHTLGIEVESIKATPDGPRIQATVDWPDYRLGIVSVGSWERFFRGGTTGTRVLLRRAARPGASGPPQVQSGKDAGEERSTLTPQELAVALLSHTILASSAFDDPKPVHHLALLDSSCEFLQSIKVHGLPTDDRLVLLPASAGIVYVARWVAAWNWIVDQATASSRARTLSDLAGDLCRSTTRIWFLGEDPERLRPSRGFLTELEKTAETYVSIASSLRPDADWSSSGETAYCDWFDILLPRIFHEAFLSDKEILSAVGIWSAAVSQGGRGNSAFDRLRSSYEPLLRPDGSTRARRERLWLFGYRVLLRNISPELGRMLGEFEREYQERKGRGSKGREALESVIQLEEGAGKYKFATRATVEGKRQAADISRLMAQLRQV